MKPVLIDTCGWIEWLTDGVLSQQFDPYFKDVTAIIVPTTVQFELYKWTKRERGESTALEVAALTEQSRVIPLNTSLALYAADLALQHRLSFADAIIYASALHAGARLITSDEHFDGLPEVIYFPKSNDL